MLHLLKGKSWQEMKMAGLHEGWGKKECGRPSRLAPPELRSVGQACTDTRSTSAQELGPATTGTREICGYPSIL